MNLKPPTADAERILLPSECKMDWDAELLCLVGNVALVVQGAILAIEIDFSLSLRWHSAQVVMIFYSLFDC